MNRVHPSVHRTRLNFDYVAIEPKKYAPVKRMILLQQFIT